MLQQQPLNEIEKRILRTFNRAISIFVVIYGKRGSGKTDFGLLIAEILFKFGLIKTFASNIKIHETSKEMEIKHITNLEDLTSWCENYPFRKLFIFDEAGKSYRRRSAMSKFNIEMLDKLQILRKYKLSIIMITPNPRYIDSTSFGSDVLDGVFIKANPNNQKILNYVDETLSEPEMYNEIYPTSIKFDTWDIAPFTLNAPFVKPIFKDKDLEILYKWAKGELVENLGIQYIQLHRIQRKFILDVLERKELHLT